MTPTAIFLLSSHGHAAPLNGTSGPLALMVQVCGFILVLLAAGLIVTAVERLRGD